VALLRLYLLGPLTLQAGEKPLPVPSTRKAQSLLAYLAMRRGQPQLRDHLADTFWPDAPAPRARRNLNTALWQIRRILPSGDHLIAGANDVRFSAESACWIDAAEFDRLCRAPPAEADDAETVARLRRAVSLYQGEFLAGLYDEWVLAERYRLETLLLDALTHLGRASLRLGEHAEALHYAERLLAHDPLREDVHRLVIELYLALGDRVAAARQCNRCRTLLRSELGVDPSPETMALCRPLFVSAQMSEESPAPDALHRRPELETPPLVGRDGELEQLLAFWKAACSGQGRAVLISGEAGVGKTRLVAELAQSAGWRDGVALWGRCYEHQRSLPLQPLAEALQNGLPYLPRLESGTLQPWMLAEVASLLPDLSRYYIGLPQPAPLAPTHAQDRLLIAVTSFLAAASAQVPLLLVLEDLQWAGEAVVAFVHYLVRHLHGMRLLLIGTYRSDEPADVGSLAGMVRSLSAEGLVTEMPLQRLSFSATARLVSEFSPPGEPDRALAQRLYRTTGGNPFYLVEILRALGDVRPPRAAIAARSLPVPQSVRDLILGRAARLPRHARELLDLAAAAGHEFDLALLQRAWERDEDELLRALDDLLRHRFLREQDARRDYAFDHDLTREVIYQGLHHHRRRRLHRQVGRALEALAGHLGERPVAELAYHLHEAYSRGDDPGPAATYGLEAADQALRHYARREALAWYRRSRALLDSTGLTPGRAPTLTTIYARLCLGEGLALFFLGEHDEAVSALGTGLTWADAASDAPTRADLLLALGRAAHEVGDLALAADRFRLAAAQSQALGDRTRMAEALHQLARTAYDAGNDPLETAARSEQALALSQELGDLNLQGLAHWTLGRVCYRRARFAAAEDHYRQALDCFREVGNREDEGWTCLLWGMIDGLRYALDRAVARFEAAEAIFRDLERPWGIGASLTQRGMIHLRRGELGRAVQLLQEALQLFRRAGNRWEQPAVLWHLGLASYHDGRLEDALKQLTEGLALAETIEQPELCLLTCLTMGDVYAARGAWLAAEATYGRALALGRATDDRRFLPRGLAGLAGVALARGEVSEAARRVAEGHSLASREDVEAQGLLLRLAGEVADRQGRQGEALTLLQQSVEVLAGPPVPFELARSQLVLARLKEA
jgi:DNA-binding SARP family transcriptional activator